MENKIKFPKKEIKPTEKKINIKEEQKLFKPKTKEEDRDVFEGYDFEDNYYDSNNYYNY